MKEELSYILGNPPFLGKQFQSKEQKAEMSEIFQGVKGFGVLDYVTAWYLLAAKYIQGTKVKVAFVSTNSISQGEQVAILWNELFEKYKIKIQFAHRTFNWKNKAKGKAAVHVIIVGFSTEDSIKKLLYEYNDINSEPFEISVKNINPYLVESSDLVVSKRRKVLCDVPEIAYGSMANDGGFLVLSEDDKNELLLKNPTAKSYIKEFLGSYEFINNIKRYCIWLKDVAPSSYRSHSYTLNRIEQVKQKREASTRAATKKLADFPMLFGEIRQPATDYLLIPGVSSVNRKYIPIGYLSKDVIASDLARTISNPTFFLFGVLTSIQHMTWVKYVSGKLKSDYRYSNILVYNNYPFPKDVSDKEKEKVESAAKNILEVRTEYPDSSLADLYDPLSMPPKLVKAHQVLDKAVDQCYRKKAFRSERERIEFLFELYEEYTKPLLAK